MAYKTVTFPDDSKIIKSVIGVGVDDVQNKKFEVYSYKFPINTIYVGYTSYGLELRDREHRRCCLSPIYHYLKVFPDVYPEVELVVENVSFNDLNKLVRKIFDSNLNMKILNENLYLYGY